jgi:monoamine oxidase
MVGAGATAAAAGMSGIIANAAAASERNGTTSGKATSGRATSGRATSGRATSGRATSGRATSGGATPEVVIVGSGIAGLGCAYKLWREHGIRARVYEYNTVPGGRIRTLRGYFEDLQHVEEHAEFVNPEHTKTLDLANSLGLTLDNADHYPLGTHPRVETMLFRGKFWSQKSLDQDWQDWARKLFHHFAFKIAPWPVLYNKYPPGAKKLDLMSVSEWIETYIPGGAKSDFGALCIAAVLDEFGGPPDEQSALNLVYLLGQDDSSPNGSQPHKQPQLDGANEKWHIHGGTDLLISGLIERLPKGTVNLGRKLVALQTSSNGGFLCSFESDGHTRDVKADHVVLALPFTTLRQVDLHGVSNTITPLHMRAIREEPLGTNSKFFVQCNTRVWNTEDHRTGNAYSNNAVQGAWDPTIYQTGEAGILVALPGGTPASKWGSRYNLTDYLGTPPDHMTREFLDAYDALFPGVKDAYNGKSFFVWSPGDPHILGAYSYLKVGQYTGFNGIQGKQEKNLHFAGEQTSIGFQGYIEGGLRSGYRCASEIAADIGAAVR